LRKLTLLEDVLLALLCLFKGLRLTPGDWPLVAEQVDLTSTRVGRSRMIFARVRIGRIGFGRWSCSRAVACDAFHPFVTSGVMLANSAAPRRPRHRAVGLPNQSASCLPSRAKDEPDIAGPISQPAPGEQSELSRQRGRRRMTGRLS